MVVGGGISGIQAALDLATSGYKVYLVEKAPTIGGKMAQLDKTFPTNDCSMCIESPKFIECDRHPNIEILTYTEVDTVEGEAGDFEVTLTRKPRYVNEDVCTGCTTCVEYCPIHSPGSVQPGAVGQQGHPHLLLPGRSAGPLHRRPRASTWRTRSAPSARASARTRPSIFARRRRSRSSRSGRSSSLPATGSSIPGCGATTATGRSRTW